MAAMLGDHDRDRRQLGDLTTPRPPGGQLLLLAELAPAAPAAVRIVVDELVNLVLRRQRTTGALMPGLAASTPPLPIPREQLLRLRPRLRPPLLTRLRRIVRGRLRTSSRALPRPLLKTPDPFLQQPSLRGQPLYRRGQLENHLDTTIPPRVIDRLGLRPLHTTQFDNRTEVPSPESRQLNGYLL